MSENSNQKKPLPTIWRVPDELWEIIEPILQEQDPPSRGPACRFGRDHLQDEKRGPVEPTARRVSRRLLGTPDLPEMDRAWRAGSHLGESHRALRGARWGGLCVAGRGRRYGQGSFWGTR